MNRPMLMLIAQAMEAERVRLLERLPDWQLIATLREWMKTPPDEAWYQDAQEALEWYETHDLQPGTQIAYIPHHVHGDITHPDVQFGFVVTPRDRFAFCRYWSQADPNELRTKANSEATGYENLVKHNSHPQGQVDELLQAIREGRDVP